MSEHKATIAWEPNDAPFTYDTYTRDHIWRFAGGHQVPASAAEAFRGDADRVDPEEGLVATLSSCHMLTFLAIAAKKRIEVTGYHDEAVGILEKNSDGRLAVTRVTLRPKITFAGTPPTAEALADLHHKSHEACFIANSVHCEIVVENAP